jgi:pimeloyl-ACP methyl ester carboxylesterase
MNEMIYIGGHPTWVDARGAGDETVVLLHGGMSHSGLLLDAFGDALTDRYRVLSFDRRGGHRRSSARA